MKLVQNVAKNCLMRLDNFEQFLNEKFNKLPDKVKKILRKLKEYTR